MKIKILFALVALCVLLSPAYAQEKQVGVSAVYVHSPGTGNQNGIGVKVDTVVPFNNFATALAEFSWVVEPKAYIGDGHAFRGRAELRLQPFHDFDQPLFVSVGGSIVHQRTSQYTKTAYAPTLAVGGNIRDRVVVQYKHYFEEQQTQNHVSANEINGELYLPLNDSRWLIRASLSAINTRFSQPAGWSNAGRYSVWSYQTSMGAAYRF